MVHCLSYICPVRWNSHPETPSSPGRVGLARAHPLTKTQAMEPSRETRSSYGPPYPLRRWSSGNCDVLLPSGDNEMAYRCAALASEALGRAFAAPFCVCVLELVRVRLFLVLVSVYVCVTCVSCVVHVRAFMRFVIPGNWFWGGAAVFFFVMRHRCFCVVIRKLDEVEIVIIIGLSPGTSMTPSTGQNSEIVNGPINQSINQYSINQ